MPSDLDDWSCVSPADRDAIADFVEPFGGRPLNSMQMALSGFKGRAWMDDPCAKCSRRVLKCTGPDGKDCEFAEMLYHLRLPSKAGYSRRRLFQAHSCGKMGA